MEAQAVRQFRMFYGVSPVEVNTVVTRPFSCSPGESLDFIFKGR